MKKIYLIVFAVFCLFIFNTKACALSDGIYTIHSLVDNNYVVDITGGIATNSNNIQLYKFNNSNAQKFKITKIDDEYYRISSVISENYSLDVTGSYYKDSTNIQLYTNNIYDSQKWIIEDRGNNNYEIISSNNKYCLDLQGGIAVNSKNIQLYSCNNSNAQKFIFKKSYKADYSIENGIYTISSSIDSNKQVGINDAVIKNSNNVVLREVQDDFNKWVINYEGNGYYTIKSYLDVKYSLNANGNNADVKLYNSSNNQKWIIRKKEDGNYNIISKDTGLFIDLVGGNATNNNNIQLYYDNDSMAQSFVINKVTESGQKTIEDGTYFLSPRADYNKLLDITGANIVANTNIQLYQGNYGIAQKWYIEYGEDGYYKIYSDYNRNYALDYTNYYNLVLNSVNNNDSQKWIIKYTGSSYYFISKTGVYLDLYGGYTYNSNNMQVHEFNGSDAQKFDIRKTVSGISENVIPNGVYMISSKLDNNMMVDLVGGNTANGNNIQLYQRNGAKAQKWRVRYLSNGYYEISSLNDLTKTIDVASAGTAPGTNVQLYESNKSPAQQWIIKDAGDGYFYIISNCSGLYFDVMGANAVNWANIWMYNGNGSDAQKFKFIKTMEQSKVIDVSAHQGNIDWNKVYNTGIYGVILRIGTWENLDSRFYSYLDEVERLGIPYGIYLFSYASTTNGANIEANFTKKVINGQVEGHYGRYLNPTLGIYYDIEDWYISEYNTSNILSKWDYDNIIYTYINSVSSDIAGRYKVKVYANSNYALNRFNDYSRSQVDWLADYRGYKGYAGPVSLWQYTSSATLDGIYGYVDMSYLQ